MTNQFELIAPMYAALFVSALLLIPLTLYILGPLVTTNSTTGSMIRPSFHGRRPEPVTSASATG
jgi:hypothetical protein